MEKISAVVIHYNNYSRLSALIRDLKTQTLKVDEIIVVDDHSDLDTFQKIKQRYSDEIKLYRNKSNLGPGAARNAGLKRAINALVVFFDGDLRLIPSTIQSLLGEYRKQPGYAFYVPRILDEQNRNIIHGEELRFHYLGISLFSRQHLFDQRKCTTKPSEINLFSGQCYLLNRQYLSGDCLSDETFYYCLEDLDLAFRNRVLGNRSLLVPQATAYHKAGSSKNLSYTGSEPYPTKRLFFLVRNKWLFIIKNYPLTLLLLIIPLEIMLDIVIAIYSLLLLDDKFVVVKSYRSLISNLNHALCERKKNNTSPKIRAFILNEKFEPLRVLYNSKLLSAIFLITNYGLALYGHSILRLKDTPSDNSL